MERVNVYIDGFNLYYRALKNTPYKWLDIRKLVSAYLPSGAALQRLQYFTARVSAWPHDPGQPVRQDAYLRALKSLPGVEIVEGSFLAHPRRMPVVEVDGAAQRVVVSIFGVPLRLPLYHPTPPGRPQLVTVLRTDEKGSDVNLASRLIRDACNNDFDIAMVVSNDSDLAEPLRIVRDELGLKVGVLNPSATQYSSLSHAATFVKRIRRSALAASQFPRVVVHGAETIARPDEWRSH